MILRMRQRIPQATAATLLLLLLSSFIVNDIWAAHAPIPRYNSNDAGKGSILLRERAKAMTEQEIERRFFVQKKGGANGRTSRLEPYESVPDALPAVHAERGRASVAEPTKARNIHHAEDSPQNEIVTSSPDGHRKYTRRLVKDNGGSKKEGTAKLRVDNDKINVKKVAVEDSPIGCKERKAKECKKTAVERKAGENRGVPLIKEGSPEQKVLPDYSLQEESPQGMQYDYMYDDVGGSTSTLSNFFQSQLQETSDKTQQQQQQYADDSIPLDTGAVESRYTGVHNDRSYSSSTSRAAEAKGNEIDSSQISYSAASDSSQRNYRPSSGFYPRAPFYTAQVGQGDDMQDNQTDDVKYEEQRDSSAVGDDNTGDDTPEDVQVSMAVDDAGTSTTATPNGPTATTTATATSANNGGKTVLEETTKTDNSYLTFYGSQNATSSFTHSPGSLTASRAPTGSRPPTSAPEALLVDLSKENSTAMDNETDGVFAIQESKGVLGTIMYFSKVPAAAVYVEAKGAFDLSTRKEDVFNILEPLMSRHLQDSFAEALITDYQLTISYIKAADSVTQLRKSTENSKIYTTELVVTVVLNVKSSNRDEVAAVTQAKATEAVQSFFATSSSGLKTFLRILNDQEMPTQQIRIQSTPYKPSSEYSIAKLTPGSEVLKSGSSGDKLMNNAETQRAVTASLVAGLIVVLAVGGSYWLNRDRREWLVGNSALMLDSARHHGAGAVSKIQARSSGAAKCFKSNVQDITDRMRTKRGHGYFNFIKTSSNTSVESDITSKLSYIQPAAIQLRRGRRQAQLVPHDDTPLPGRQDEENLGSTVYDIDLDSDNEDISIPEVIEEGTESDYSVNSSIDNNSDDGTTLISRQDSIDRVSVARNRRAVEERMERMKSFNDGYADDHANYTYAAESTYYSPTFGMARKSFSPSSSSNAPLSPLSAELDQALADSPKPVKHVVRNNPDHPIIQRRGTDPPESSFARHEDYCGSYMSPPTSMQDIMDDEYLNKARWGEESQEESSAYIPDYLSGVASRYSTSTTQATQPTENRLIVLPDEDMRTRPYEYRY